MIMSPGVCSDHRKNHEVQFAQCFVCLLRCCSKNLPIDEFTHAPSYLWRRYFYQNTREPSIEHDIKELRQSPKLTLTCGGSLTQIEVQQQLDNNLVRDQKGLFGYMFATADSL